MSRTHAALAALLLAAAPLAQGALVINALNPVGGALTGIPSATVGWGFTVFNDSTSDWLVISSSRFLTLPGWGSYADLVGPQGIVLQPEAILTQTFSAATGSGAGSFAINPAAGLGWTVSGNLELLYDIYDSDPDADDSVQTGASTVRSAASVTVAESAAVPLPPTAALLALGLFGMRRARRAA
jgi:hypothetical protein